MSEIVLIDNTEAEAIHPYLDQYETDRINARQAKREARQEYQKQYMKEYWKTYVKPPKTVIRDRELNLKRYHRIRKSTLCETCNKEYMHIKYHKTTNKHIQNLGSPIDVVKDMYPDIMEPIAKELEELKQEKETLTDKLNTLTINPMQIQAKKSRYGATKLSYA